MFRRFARPLASLTLPALALSAGACFDLGDASSTHTTISTHVTDWRDETIYQVLVDRFADSDPGNDWRVDRSSLARYQGGDWQGLIDHIDYFTALGVTTIWISPIVRNVDTDAGIDGYHGYWASDLAELNPHFGDLGTLRRFVNLAHQRGLRVVLDIVVNHMGQMFYYDINQNGRPDDNLYGGGYSDPFQNPGGVSDPNNMLTRVSEFDPNFNSLGVIQSYTSLGPAGAAPVVFLNMPEIFRVPPGFSRACDPNVDLSEQPDCNDWQHILAVPDGYHRRGRIVTYDEPNHMTGDQVLHGDFPGGLKDVATENPLVRAAMIQAYARWVEQVDFDGFRIDTLKHVEHEFWQAWAPAVRARLHAHGKDNFLMFGEAFDGDDLLVSSYTQPNEMDSVVYFPQKYQVFQNVFQCEGPTQAVQDLLTSRAANYSNTPQPMGANAAPSQLLVNFMDNHDVPRFLAGQFGSDPSFCPAGRVNTDADLTLMRAKLHAALAYLYTEDGIPCLYYGTEQDFRGANDPSNREVMWAGDHAYDTSGDTFQLVARLTRIRRAYPALRHGSLDIKWVTMRTQNEEDAGILAFERNPHSSDATVLVALNAHSAGMSHTSFGGGAMTTSFSAGTVLVDALSSTNPRTFTVGANGALTVDLAPWETVILVPQNQVQTLGM